MANGQETNEALNIAQNNIQQEQQRRDLDNFGKAQGQKTSGVLSSLKEAFSNVDLSFDSSSISDAFLEAPEKLSRQDIFPALDQPLKVGNAGGSETGNIPIFVGGGDVFPTEIINARVRALSKGAKKTREENKKLEESFEFLDTADQFEGALNGQLIDLTEEFRGKYRNNWRKASKDPEFRKRYAELKSNAGRFSALSEKAVGILAAVKDGKQHVPKIAKDAAAKIANGSKNFEDLTKEEIFALEKDMITFESMTSGATRLASKIEKDFTTEFETLSLDDKKIVNEHLSNMKAGDFSGLAVIKKTMPNFDRVSAVANSDYDNGSYGAIDNQGRREDYINTVWSLMGTKSEVSFQKLTTEEEQRVTDAKLKDQQDRTKIAARQASAREAANQLRQDELDYRKQLENVKKEDEASGEITEIDRVIGNTSIEYKDKEWWFFDPDEKKQVTTRGRWTLPQSKQVETTIMPQTSIVIQADNENRVGKVLTVDKSEYTKIIPITVESMTVAQKDIIGENKEVLYTKGQPIKGLNNESLAAISDDEGNILDKYKNDFAGELFIIGETSGREGSDKIAIAYNTNKDILGNIKFNGMTASDAVNSFRQNSSPKKSGTKTPQEGDTDDLGNGVMAVYNGSKWVVQ